MSGAADQLGALEARLDDIAGAAAARAQAAIDLRDELVDEASALSAEVLLGLFSSMGTFVAQWRAAERLLHRLGMPLHPIDQHLLREDEGATLEAMRGVAREIVGIPVAEQWYPPGGVVDDVLRHLRAEPEQWRTARELATATRRCISSIYGRGCLRQLLERRMVDVRCVPINVGGWRRLIRQYRISGSPAPAQEG